MTGRRDHLKTNKNKSVLVRNSEQKVRKTKNCVTEEPTSTWNQFVNKLVSDKRNYEKSVSDMRKNKLSEPELCSSLKYADKMKKVTEVTLGNVKKNKDENITADALKKLNFASETKLYSDLVSLNISDTEVRHHIKESTAGNAIRRPKYKKDEELKIEDFIVDIPVEYIKPDFATGIDIDRHKKELDDPSFCNDNFDHLCIYNYYMSNKKAFVDY